MDKDINKMKETLLKYVDPGQTLDDDGWFSTKEILEILGMPDTRKNRKALYYPLKLAEEHGDIVVQRIGRKNYYKATGKSGFLPGSRYRPVSQDHEIYREL